MFRDEEGMKEDVEETEDDEDQDEEGKRGGEYREAQTGEGVR